MNKVLEPILHLSIIALKGLIKLLWWLLKGVFGLLALFLVAVIAYMEHEMLQRLASEAQTTYLGRWVFRSALAAKRWLSAALGIPLYDDSPKLRWAGLYKSYDADDPVTLSLDQKAKAIKTDITGRSSIRSYYLIGEPGSGVREVAQQLYRVLERENPPYNVFYFDCSSVPDEDVHSRFLSNISAWSKTSGFRSGADDEFGPADDGFRESEVRLFLKRSRGPQKIAIILDFNRLVERGSDEHRRMNTLNCLRLLKDAVQTRVVFTASQALPVTYEQISDQATQIAIKESFKEWCTKYFEKAPRELLRNDSRFVPKWARGRAFVEVYGGISKASVEATLKLKPETQKEQVKYDDVMAFVAMHGQMDISEKEDLVSNFRAWIRGQLSERILSRAEDRSADRQKFCALLEALSGIDSPVPLPSVYKLATKWHIDMTQELPWAEPRILRELIELGVVQKLVPDDAVFNQNLYWLRPAFREEVKKQSPISDVLQRERRGEIYREIMASLRPAGITPISKYVSQGDFRSSPSLIGCFRHGVEGRELYFLLPQQICEVISVAHRGSVLPECGLRFYGWKDAIEEKVDLVSYLSPAEMSIANRVCRVQVHIVSRAGSGRAVQRALEPFVHAFLDSEGDSSRIGPGGYFELLVQLLRAEEIAKESRLPEIVRDRAEKILKARDLDADARESRIFALVQDQVRNTLRAGIDHDAFVRIVPCTPLAARNDWITITKPGGVGIAVVRTDARAYGISSRYQLVVREPALSEIIKHLSRTHEQTVDTIVIDCVYSFTCLQAIFVFKSLNMSERVRVQISSTAESAGRHLTPRFMEVLERKMVNLASMRHGPYGAYVVDFELPQGLMAKQELVEEVLTELNEAGVNMKFISGVSNVLTDVQATDATQNAPTGPRFGSGEVFDPNKFDYVLDPDSFHRAMRKHLFIPESDAAIIATVRNYMAQRCDEDCRVLEIGSATGGLSEKLISAGVQNLDTLDPDQKLSDYWVSHKKTFYPAAAGLHYCLTLETYASQSARLYDILVSQGVHHHIPTSDANQFPEQDYRLLFLRQCASLLRDGGIYVLSDEFLCDYGLGDDKYRIERLDQWYRMVIATATAEGHLELADLEYGFWLNDHFQTAEYKESIECFEARLRGAGERAPFQIENITRFGLTEEYGGGFGVLVLKKRSQSI